MSWETYSKYPIVMLTGLLTALLLTPVWSHIAKKLGILDQPGGRKIHDKPIPRGGGVAVFLGFHAVCAVVFLFPWQPFFGQISIEWWFRFIPISAAVVLVGLLDDWMDIRAPIKLALQFALSVAAYYAGIRMQNILGVQLPLWVDFAATVLWFLVLMNSFNLIDGIDGLATGIAMIASAGIALSMIFRSAPGDVLLFIGFAGVCLGFLRYNFYPASVFLGDSGSLFIGFTLGALALSTNSKGTAIAGIGMPLLAVGVPVFDAALAVWRRSVRRLLVNEPQAASSRIGKGDADHIHHRLLSRVQTHSRVAIMLYGITILLTASGILASMYHDRALGILALTFLAAAYTVMRHLAWIELRDSGKAVLQGVSRPIRRNRTLLYYIAIDMVILNSALIISKLLIDVQDGTISLSIKNAWLSAATTDVVIPFFILLLFRAYTRVWYLARVSEYIAAGLAAMLGCGLACAVSLISASGANNPSSVVLYYVVFSGFVVPSVVGVRAFIRMIQDALSWRGRSSAGNKKRILICGAGYRTTLLLRHISFSEQTTGKSVLVVGLADRDDAIRGHYVHGLKVLGSYAELPALIKKFAVNGIYISEDVTVAELALIREATQAADIQLVSWNITESIVA